MAKTDQAIVPHVKNETARDVWQYVSQHPTQSVREIAKGTGYGYATVCNAIRQLAAQGHIEYQPKAARARRIAIPMAAIDGTQIKKKLAESNA